MPSRATQTGRPGVGHVGQGVVVLLLAIFKHGAGCCEGVWRCGLSLGCCRGCWLNDSYLIDTELFMCCFVGVVAMSKLTFY